MNKEPETKNAYEMCFRFRFLVRSIGIATISGLLYNCHPKPVEIRLADYLVKAQLTTSADTSTIHHVVDTLLDSTAWRGKIQINKAYDPTLVNLYIIDGNTMAVKLDNQLSPLLSNCYYAGSNIIFIDDAYLRSFLKQHHVINDRPTADLMGDQECFFYWVIGHELGHLVYGHQQGYFDTASLDRFVKTSSLKNIEELQADSFFVRAIVYNRRLRYSEQRLMMNILNAEIEQKIGKVQTMGVGIIYDYTNQHVVSYARQPTHPEYVVRLARMLELSTKMGGDAGLFNLVSGFIKQLKEVE